MARSGGRPRGREAGHAAADDQDGPLDRLGDRLRAGRFLASRAWPIRRRSSASIWVSSVPAGATRPPARGARRARPRPSRGRSGTRRPWPAAEQAATRRASSSPLSTAARIAATDSGAQRQGWIVQGIAPSSATSARPSSVDRLADAAAAAEEDAEPLHHALLPAAKALAAAPVASRTEAATSSGRRATPATERPDSGLSRPKPSSSRVDRERESPSAEASGPCRSRGRRGRPRPRGDGRWPRPPRAGSGRRRRPAPPCPPSP